MSNYSYEISEQIICNYPGKAQQMSTSYQKRLYQSWGILDQNETTIQSLTTMRFHNPNLNLGFVVCQSRGILGIEYMLLTNVFDPDIWKLLLACYILAAFALTYISKHNPPNLNSYLTASYKVLVDQGGPYEFIRIDSVQSRVLITFGLLAGVVLSNAYKNSNVYKMTLPRKLTPYESFEQLMEDNFTILTRIDKAYYVGIEDALTSNISGSEDDWSLDYLDNAGIFVSHPNGVAIIADTEWYTQTFISGVNKSSELFRGLRDTMKLPVEVLQELQRPFDNAMGLRNFTLKLKNAVALFQEFRQWEETFLVSLLRGAPKVAVMLPDVDAVKYMKRIQNEGGLVYRGRMKFTRIVHIICFTGLTKWSLQVRLRIIEESGILQRWDNIFHTNGMIGAKFENKVSAASMSGNIVIIFLVLICGLALALFMILLENTFQSLAMFCRYWY